MRLLISFLAFGAVAQAQQLGYSVLGQDNGAWPEILDSIGLFPKAAADADVIVARRNFPFSSEWNSRVEAGAFLILEGDSGLARSFGFVPTDRTTRLTSITDRHMPETPLIFERPVELTETSAPKRAEVFAFERWTKIPVIAGFRQGKGAVLWLATSPGPHGYERFPFIAHALSDLGFVPRLRGNRLWAFFDYSYRTRVDVDWFAKRWHAAGIAALHVAAWHFYDADAERDRYLKALIDACHREGVLVYAWLELPHVSERFWADHPEWREKTALLQDAQLDWRKLMNLADPQCAAAVRSGLRGLVGRFDWDGVNLAELYYESLEGAANPARFTPMNDVVRRAFQAEPNGFDPVELWSARKDGASLRKFLDFRAGMARALQTDWLTEAESYRVLKPDLDVVLTHVDDRLDTGMRDAIGADTSRIMPLVQQHRFTFLLEDPATVWDQGAKRYATIAAKYPLASQLSVDINVVERYQDVYPTKQQVGAELFQLVHQANVSFGRVALYIENSLAVTDLPLLDASSQGFFQADWQGGTFTVKSRQGGGIRWTGPASVDNQLWPVREGDTLWIPAGTHTIRLAKTSPGFTLTALTGELTGAVWHEGAVEFTYSGEARVIAKFSSTPARIELDGKDVPLAGATPIVLLPRGSHSVIAWPQWDEPGISHRRDSR